MIAKEEWVPIKGFENLYEVSNRGNVKSIPTITYNSNGRPYTRKGRLLKPASKNGYKRVILFSKSKQKSYLVHRLVALSFIENPDNKPYINHIDGDPSNNILENLEWCTPKENVDHAIKTGLSNVKGSNHGSSKLTEREVVEIRNLYRSKKYNQREISENFNITQALVSMIIGNKIWNHI